MSYSFLDLAKDTLNGHYELMCAVELLIQNNKNDVLNRVANLICRIVNILPDSEDENKEA